MTFLPKKNDLKIMYIYFKMQQVRSFILNSVFDSLFGKKVDLDAIAFMLVFAEKILFYCQ